MTKKKYVLAGTGSRGINMFGKPLTFDKELSDHAEIVGFYDSSPLRMEYARKVLEKSKDFPAYTDFDKLCEEVEFDGLIVATRDAFHAEVIINGLKRNKKVFSEKPLCINEHQVREILRAEQASEGEIYVTHNVRYSPVFSKIKEIVDSGEIGRVISYTFNESLDRRHGADYFRRWHAVKANSGGLAVHKSCHQFDIINYIIGSFVEKLYAMGDLSFYGKNGPFRGERCSTCEHADTCDFYADIFSNERAIGLYKDAESDDGYIRDNCLFRTEIDAEDNFCAVLKYQNGVRGAYALTAFCPFEGHRLEINGDQGRLEYFVIGEADWAPGVVTTPGLSHATKESLTVFSTKTGVKEIDIPEVKGGHGGSDPQLRIDFFTKSWEGERNPRMASLMEGAQAVLVGAAVNISIKEKREVDVQDLLKGDIGSLAV